MSRFSISKKIRRLHKNCNNTISCSSTVDSKIDMHRKRIIDHHFEKYRLSKCTSNGSKFHHIPKKILEDFLKKNILKPTKQPK